ncbi:hypothetical protein F511_35521 [Dorcoceras hygrometricum]|uniref:Uncharacterized protein n=1 Tax=Dorcoceras hygrometricum TaxID=472368 RepID=A0A2Z7CZD8_9LAMI|nr:hypothetical protein F511_35521 [Dorcoceras hygrometricum]
MRQRGAQFVPPAVRLSQENQQIPPPPRFDTGGSSSGKKNSLKAKGNNSSVQVLVALLVPVNLNNKELDRNPAIIVLNVEAGISLNSVEECLDFATSVINLDTLRGYVLNVVLEVHRILDLDSEPTS